MEIVQTRNMQLAYSILSNPVIAKEISGPEGFGNYYPNNRKSHIYLTSYVNDKPIGLFIIHPNNRKEWVCHVQVLPKFREKYAKEFGLSVIQWVWDNTDIPYLIANISLKYPNVRKFGHECGFKTLTKEKVKKGKNTHKFGIWKLKIDRPNS